MYNVVMISTVILSSCIMYPLVFGVYRFALLVGRLPRPVWSFDVFSAANVLLGMAGDTIVNGKARRGSFEKGAGELTL